MRAPYLTPIANGEDASAGGDGF
ncbi:MAG: hypothetical protein K0S86_1966, partial [Geminicoccaceae bacterium]|nr:hypothetical protein [Geminicoccaceae bacterium]